MTRPPLLMHHLLLAFVNNYELRYPSQLAWVPICRKQIKVCQKISTQGLNPAVRCFLRPRCHSGSFSGSFRAVFFFFFLVFQRMWIMRLAALCVPDPSNTGHSPLAQCPFFSSENGQLNEHPCAAHISNTDAFLRYLGIACR
jgi:hypothetical protein